ncbi:MAG: PilN domain-containing protein [Candidatus Blackburnbacteria bacterium]|nr:PilN domain-containing protein [Candidatus Blackburnbacteria bacterium]
MSASKKRKVNLLIQEGFEHTLLGKILNWSLSVGRVIVILTELVVIVAFLSRFWLDRTLTDLNEANGGKKKQIEASQKFENEFKNAQEKLSFYKKTISSQPRLASLVTEGASLLPPGVVLTTISLKDQDVVFSGEALSEEGLAGFVKSLKASTNLKDVTLSSISLETEGQQTLKFTTKASLKTKEVKKEKVQEEKPVL